MVEHYIMSIQSLIKVFFILESPRVHLVFKKNCLYLISTRFIFRGSFLRVGSSNLDAGQQFYCYILTIKPYFPHFFLSFSISFIWFLLNFSLDCRRRTLILTFLLPIIRFASIFDRSSVFRSCISCCSSFF